jgi:hypothetical protein
LKNSKIKINAAGMINGMRNKKDGITFFGKNLKNVKKYLI